MGQTESEFLKSEGIPTKPKLAAINLHPNGPGVQFIKTRELMPSWADSFPDYGNKNTSEMENSRAEILGPSVKKVMRKKDRHAGKVSRVW